MTDKQAQCMRNYLNTAVISGVKLLHLTTDELSGLLDELEAKDKLNAELQEKQRLIDICQGQGLEHRIAAEKRAEAAEKRIAELEALEVTVNLPDRRDENYDWDGATPTEAFNTCLSICSLMFGQSLRAAGIGKGE